MTTKRQNMATKRHIMTTKMTQPHCLFLSLSVWGSCCLRLPPGSQVSHFPSFSSRSVVVVLSVSLIGPPPATVCGAYSECVSKACVCLLGAPPDSQLSAPASPASPTQDIWVLRSSPTGKGVWSQTPATPQPLCEPVDQIPSQPS